MACKKGILILSPEAKDSEISSRESEWNAKTRFPKERDGEGKVKRKRRKKWKERRKKKMVSKKEIMMDNIVNLELEVVVEVG